MKIKGYFAGTIFIFLMVIGIFISAVSGYWATESSKEPLIISTGEHAGEYDPADIRGSYSLGDIEAAFSIPAETLAAAFGLGGESNPESIQVKSFEETFGLIDGKELGTDSMRYFVALYKGIPYDAPEDTALPRPALSILKKEGAMTADELAKAEEHAVSIEGLHTTVSSSPEDESEKTVKGNTLFSDLYGWGLTKEEVEKILGMPPGDRGESVRDFCMSNNIEFSTVKEPLQELVDSK